MAVLFVHAKLIYHMATLVIFPNSWYWYF